MRLPRYIGESLYFSLRDQRSFPCVTKRPGEFQKFHLRTWHQNRFLLSGRVPCNCQRDFADWLTKWGTLAATLTNVRGNREVLVLCVIHHWGSKDVLDIEFAMYPKIPHCHHKYGYSSKVILPCRSFLTTFQPSVDQRAHYVNWQVDTRTTCNDLLTNQGSKGRNGIKGWSMTHHLDEVFITPSAPLLIPFFCRPRWAPLIVRGDFEFLKVKERLSGGGTFETGRSACASYSRDMHVEKRLSTNELINFIFYRFDIQRMRSQANFRSRVKVVYTRRLCNTITAKLIRV